MLDSVSLTPEWFTKNLTESIEEPVKLPCGAGDEKCKYWHWFGQQVCWDLMPYTEDLVMADPADHLAQGLAKLHRCIGGVEMKKAVHSRFAETARLCARYGHDVAIC